MVPAPLVLASGPGRTSKWRKPHVERFAREFTVLVLDQRGTGRSSRLPVASIEQMSAALITVLDAVGLERAH
jgi:pimeloyl-ACP methyl ester carboxylesterase